MRTLWLSLMLLVVLTTMSGAAAQEDFDAIPGILKFKPIAVNTDIVTRESGKDRLDWYMIFEVTNPGDKAKTFNPKLRATSDKKVKYIDLSMPKVEAAVEKKLGKALAGRSDLMKIIRTLKTGTAAEKQAAEAKLTAFRTIKPKEKKLCIATFGEIDKRADFIKISIHNLSDMVRIIEKDGKKYLVEYVLTLDYHLPGDEFNMVEDDFKYVGRKWIKVEKELPTRKQ